MAPPLRVLSLALTAAQLAKRLGGALLDRFYALLYAKLLSRELCHSARQSTMLNLVRRRGRVRCG